jgi:hypothetical protein
LKLSRFTRQALGDIARIADHYDREKDGLGDKFIEGMDEAVDRIEANSEGYALAFRQLRRCNLRKFPYALYLVLVRERAAGVIEIYKPDLK